MSGPVEFSLAHVLTAALAGNAVAALWRLVHLQRCRRCAFQLQPYDDQRTLPWYGRLLPSVPVIGAVAVTLLFPRSFLSCIVLSAILIVCLVRQSRTIIKERPQFTLLGLFVFTTLVACFFGAGHYVPFVPLLVFLYLPIIEWTKQRACSYEEAAAGKGPISFGEASERIIASHCAANICRIRRLCFWSLAGLAGFLLALGAVRFLLKYLTTPTF